MKTMKTIFKVRLRIVGVQQIKLPQEFTVLSLQMQRGEVMLWAIIDLYCPAIPHTVFCVGTGQQIPEEAGQHIGTVQDGEFVWHFFGSK